MKKKSRVLVVDDHPVVRQGIAEAIRREADFEIAGEAADAPAALDAVSRCEPDLLIVDLSLATGSGLDLIRAVRSIRPDIPILVLSMHDEELYAERAIRAGANGFVSKSEPMTSIIAALRLLRSGEFAMSKELSKKALREWASGRPAPKKSPLDSLGDRELEVFRLIGRGHATREIAEELNVSPKTVETYRLRIKKKLGVPTANALIRLAAKWEV